MVGHTLQVAAPPVIVAIIIGNTFNNDQPIRIDIQHGITRFSRGTGPISRTTVTPSGTVVRFVVQVSTKDRVVTLIARGDGFPHLNPVGLTVGVAIPQTIFVRAVTCFTAVMIQHDFQANLFRVFNYTVHDFQTSRTRQIRVQRCIKPLGHRPAKDEIA